MEPVSIYKTKYHIELRDVDFNKKLKVSSLFSYFQDVASMAVDNLGIGINKLQEKFGVAWVLIRIKVDIIRNPEWNEEIIIETWPQEPRKIEFERDFLVRDAQGNVIIKAISTWIIMDINSRELKKSELIAIDYPEIRKERAIDYKLGKLKSFGHIQEAYRKVVGYSDIDFNGHLNNSKYIDFTVDCFTFEEHRRYSVKEIEVSYITEALPGETIVLFKDTSAVASDLIYIEGVSQTDGKPFFKAQVKIEAG